MGANERSVAIRLGTVGKADVKNDFVEMGDAGEATIARWSKAYERAGQDADAAADRQAKALAKLSAITPQTSMQMQINDVNSTGFGQYEGTARASALAFAEIAKSEADLAARGEALRTTLDPLYAAQKRYDDEIKNAAILLKAGAISQETYDAALASSATSLNTTKRALDAHSNGLGFNRTQFLIAEGAAHRYVDSILAGMSPMRAFMMQAGDVGNILAMDDKGVAGGLAKVRALLSPTMIELAATTAIVGVGVAAWYSYGAAVDKLNGLARGAGIQLGESGAQLEANAVSAAHAANITVAAARDIEEGYLRVAKAGDVLVGLTAITKDFAAATGQDAKGAQGELNTAFADTIAGAEAMAQKYGVLTQQEVEHIATLVEEGNQTDAQRVLLEKLQVAFDGAADHADVLARGWDRIKVAAAGAWEWMGKALDRMASGGAIQDQINALEKQRDLGPSGGQLLTGTTTDSFRAGLQQQIDALRAQMRQAAAEQTRQQEISATAAAHAIVSANTGDNRDQFRRNIGTLRQGLATNSQLDPQQRAAMTQQVDAYSNAIQTWIPRQQKINELAALDARIAATKAPAAKAALAAQREQVAMAGEVITASDATALAHSKADAAAAHATKSNGAHAASLARQAASMEAAAQASLALADAYLKGDDAAFEAEARRKAVTDATRKGIDVEDQMRRQMALAVAEAVANGAKSVAALRDEAAARGVVNDQVTSGTLDAHDMAQALSDEAALRPLLKLQTVAQGDALAALTRVIDAYRKALADSRAEENRGTALKSISDARDRIIEIKAAIADLSKDPATQAINAADRAATRTADDLKLTGQDRADYLSAQHDAAAAAAAQDQARYVDQTYRQQANDNELITAQIGLLGQADDKRAAILDHLQREQQVKERLGTLDSDAARALLAQGDALEANKLKLDALGRSMDETRQFGDKLVDDVFNPDNWKSWGDLGMSVLKDIENEFIKLALINPLKNALFGENNPTGGGFFSSLGSLFGGGGGLGSLFGGGGGGGGDFGDIAKVLSNSGIGKNATGTDNWSGGMTWVNENGPEIADLPNGTRIYPAAKTRQMMSGNDNGSAPIHNHFHLEGSVLTQDLVDQMNAIGAQATRDGAQQGFAMTRDFRTRTFGRAG